MTTPALTRGGFRKGVSAVTAGHDHPRTHDHSHSHAPDASRLAGSRSHRVRLLVAVGLVFSIVLAQGIGAWITGSLALLVDMVHSLTDSIGLLVAFVAAVLMVRPATSRRTWGYRRSEVVAALGQALLLLGVSVYALVEGVARLASPPEVPATELLWFGVIGFVLNVSAMVVLFSVRGANLNLRAAFLEVLMDALGTLAVIVSAVVMMTTGYERADTIAALFIAALIAPRAINLLRETFRVLMEFTPKGLDLDEVTRHIKELDHVIDVHDLHASTVATGLPVLSAHVVLEDECFHDGHSQEILAQITGCIGEHFEVAVEHVTIQLETAAHRAGESETHCH